MPPRRRKHDQRRSQISDILNPVTGGVRELMLRKGLTPTDHAKNNMAAVRAMSKATRDKRLRGGDMQPAKSPLSDSAATRLVEVRCTDYVTENSKNLVTRCHAAPNESSALLKEDYGMVPKYLLQFKLDRATSEAKKQAAAHPAPIATLPQDECSALLQELVDARTAAHAKLQSLPFVIQTPSQMRLKAELLGRLEELDRAIDVFSRPTIVLTSDDDHRSGARQR